MRNRVERLRIWLLGGAGLLVVVIAGFLGYARYLTHHFKFTLPGRLGVDIVRETNGFTYSQSVQGKTVYTIHAAKAVEHKDGKITLHDVSIVLYGRTQDGSGTTDRGDRGNRISGSEFEYDKNASVVRAMGVVHIDILPTDEVAAGTVLSGPSRKQGDADADSDPKVLHITTSGLVFLQKLGVAATNEKIEFQFGKMTGHAVGADYNSDTGVVVLHSAVDLSGVASGRAGVLTAARAELDRKNQIAHLTAATYVSEGQAVKAERSVVHTRADGSIERVEAEGNVTSVANGATLVAQRADVLLGAENHPRTAKLAGGLVYSAEEPLRQARGEAQASTVDFDTQGHASHAEFTGAVHMVERTRAAASVDAWTVRDLTATKVDVALAPGAGGRTVVQSAQATGGARLVSTGSPAAGMTEMSADSIAAHLVQIPASGSQTATSRVQTVDGSGHTLLHQISAGGAEQTSSGDELHARLRVEGASSSRAGQDAPGQARAASQGLDDLESAVQRGRVVMDRKAPAKAGAKPGGADAQPTRQHATAETASYDGDSDRLTLTGDVVLSDSSSVVWANQVVTNRSSGDAQAEGSVKVSYEASSSAGQPASAPPKEGDPTHVLAERAEFRHDAGIATFFGRAGRPARLWQAGSQVEAPVIEFAQDARLLSARGSGEAAGSAASVRTVLVSAGSQKPGATARRSPAAVRIVSRAMTYSDTAREAVFSGGVRVESGDETMRAEEATAYLAARPGPGEKAASTPSTTVGTGPSLGGSVERIVATGHIEIEQPGRRGTGERLVYTSADSLFVLTGDASAAPRVTDTVRGITTTGASLRFHSDDESVVVSNEAGPVRTETRVRH